MWKGEKKSSTYYTQNGLFGRFLEFAGYDELIEDLRNSVNKLLLGCKCNSREYGTA